MKKIFTTIITVLFTFTLVSGCSTDGGINIPFSELSANEILQYGNQEYDKLSFSDLSALELSATNATLDGNVYYSGIRPYRVGVILGKQEDQFDFNIVGIDDVNHSKNPFDMWYNLQSECNITLTPSTNYYFRFFAFIDRNGDKIYSSKSDVIVISDLTSFTTLD